MTRRTLLIVTYHYAPSPAVGAKRFSFLAREFARQGYDVHVVTNATQSDAFGAADGSLPVTGHVHTCAARFELPPRAGGRLARKLGSLARRVLTPVGPEYFWARAATRTALAFARRLPPGVVIATSPPHAALLAGARIARALDWPLIADWRDPWSAYDWPAWRRGKWANALARRVERRVVDASAARVLNTPAMRAWFERGFPEAPSAGNHVIPNGFDAVPSTGAPPPAGPFRIVHAGEIFTGRSLVPVLAAAQRLAPRFSRPVHVVTYGELPQAERQRIDAAGLGKFLTVRPRIPFAELRTELQRAHLLLAVVGDHMLYSTPYKVYDYLAAGRPILGLAPRGAALFDLLADSGAGRCVEPDDSAAIEQVISNALGGAGEIEGARIERFRWSQLALQYKAVIERVANLAERGAESEAAWSAGTGSPPYK